MRRHTISLFLILTALPSAAVADELTIDAALAQVDDLASLQERVDAEEKALDSSSEAASSWAGPSIGVDWRDVTEMERELELTVGQAIPIDGAPAARARALREESKAAGLRGQARVQHYKAAVADTFYEALYRQKRLIVLQDRIDAVTRTRQVLRQREAAGDASQFEVERVDREVRRLQASMEREQADATAAAGELAALLANDSTADIVGTLAVEQCGGKEGRPPEVSALENEAEAERVRADQAGRSWWPTLEVQAGGVLSAPPGEAFNPGYKVGFGLAFPIWGGAAEIAEAAEARAAAIDARRALLSDQLQRRASVLSTRCSALMKTATELQAGIPRTEQLLKRAEAGYGAGELTLLELLDAQQAVLEERLDLLDLRFSARRAQNDWTTSVGGW